MFTVLNDLSATTYASLSSSLLTHYRQSQTACSLPMA